MMNRRGFLKFIRNMTGGAVAAAVAGKIETVKAEPAPAPAPLPEIPAVRLIEPQFVTGTLLFAPRHFTGTLL